MAGKRTSDVDVPRVSASFGQRAVDLAEEAGKSKQDLMDAAGISLSTLNRHLRGDGSALSAIKMKNVLRSWGVDVSTLPAVDADEDEGAAEPMDEGLREGLALIRRLWQLADDVKYSVELKRLRELVRAHELVVEGTGKVPRQPR